MAQIYLDSLDDKTTPRAVRSALILFQKRNPGSSEDEKREVLDSAYRDVMERIRGQKPGFRRLAEKVLSWIICAKRPLTILELQHALAVVVGDSRLDKDNLEQIDRIVSVCAGLVTIDEESGIIRLVHYTTQEYFERTQETWFPGAETEITEICVTYLSFDVFRSGFCDSDYEFEERLTSNPFFKYATHNWGYHARNASTISQAVIKFLMDEALVDASNQGLFAIKRYSFEETYSQNIRRGRTGLHLIAYFGIDSIVMPLLETKMVDADSKDEWGQTPLSLATEGGHKAIVKLLLETGEVDADSKDKDGRTPLSRAAEWGREAVVKLLLETGKVDADSKDKGGRTPLSWAAQRRFKAIVKLLLEASKVDVNLN